MLDDERKSCRKAIDGFVVNKDNPMVKVNDHEWKPVGRPAIDGDGATAMEGMVAAWWYDGKEILEL